MVARIPEYLVSHGKTGVVGRFLAHDVASYRRGDRVVIQGERGLAIGTVLCEATERHARILAATGHGRLLRAVHPDDEHALEQARTLAERIYTESRRLAVEMGLALEVMDVEMTLDGSRAIVQCLAGACDPAPLLDALAATHGVQVWLENLADPLEEEEEHGCGKPDCGKSEGGGCSTCSSGGGCSSCGSGKVDMRDYFGHLREQMESSKRTQLL